MSHVSCIHTEVEDISKFACYKSVLIIANHLNHRISFFLWKGVRCVAGGSIVNTSTEATITFYDNFDSLEIILVVLLELRLYPLR